MSLASSTLDDYLVASFPLPASTSASSSSTSTSQLAPPPPATVVHYTSRAREDGRLCVVTPGVGVAVYDLADQTPLSSITVGPSFTPSTSAVSRSTPSSSSESIRVKSARRTWVGVATEEGKGEVWCWHEEERKDGSTEGEAGKAVWPISEPLAALAAPRTLPSHIAFLSASGALALAPAEDLMSLSSLPAPSSAPSSQTLRLLPISSTSAPSFLPASLVALLPPTAASEAHLAIIVRTYSAPAASSSSPEPASLVEIGKKKFKKTPRASAASVIDAADASAEKEVKGGKKHEIELVVLDPKVSLPDEMEARLGLASLGRIEVEGEQVVVSDDGFVTALSANGTLASSRLSFTSAPTLDNYASLFFPSAVATTASSAETNDATSPLALTPVKTLSLSPSSLSLPHASLLALHSSFVLLAAPRPSSDGSAPIVSATLWDARFGSAIATTDLTVPAAVASSLSTLTLSLSLPAKHTAIVTLSPSVPASPGSPSGSRTALFGLPLSLLPSASVLAAVVGKHALTARFLASNASVDSVLARAKRAEPIRSVKLASLNEKKVVLLDASRDAREGLLEALEKVLSPLKEGGKKEEQDEAVEKAEKLWSEYLEGEKDRLLAYNQDKARTAMEKEQERKMATLRGEGAEGVEGAAAAERTKYLAAKRKVEKALKAAGASVTPGEEGGKTSWKEVTGTRIKGVTDKHRYRYQRERNKIEEEMGKTVKDFDVEDAVSKVERYEPSLPSSFITALFRLSFPVPLTAPSSSTDLVIASSTPSAAAAASKQVFRHPTKIVSYLLQRELVGDNQVLGGVTAFLARAGDWNNILLALRTVSDIPEATTVSLLIAVVRAASTSSATAAVDADAMDVDSTAAFSTLPQPTPSLSTFLPAFLLSPYTPAVLRSQLQSQLAPGEAIPVLELCDAWLSVWLRAEKVAEAGVKGERKVKRSKVAKAVGVRDVFKLGSRGVPELEQVVPFVQALLDAHFVPLLLQRQAHSLLRRLSKRVAAHTELVTDLASLTGALSIYARKKDELKRAEERKKSEEAAEAKRMEGEKKVEAGGVKGSEAVKSFGERMERRIRAQEKHAEVGLYQVDEFYL